jgi:hypothetical protein
MSRSRISQLHDQGYRIQLLLGDRETRLVIGSHRESQQGIFYVIYEPPSTRYSMISLVCIDDYFVRTRIMLYELGRRLNAYLCHERFCNLQLVVLGP